MKTLKQVADELGVSKDKVKYRVGKLPENYLVKIENVTHVTPEGESVLRDFFSSEKSNVYLSNYPNYPDNTHLTKLITMLENELDIKNSQIETLQNSLAAAQALHAATVARLPDKEEKPQGGIFSRIFKR